MNAGGVTLLCMCKTPKGQRHPAFVVGEERRLPPDKSGGYSQDTPTGVSQCGNKQVVCIGKPRRGDTLLTGCFSFRLRQASLAAQPRKGDTLLTARFNVRKLGNKYYKL
ncbi:MAG: hypothetical protein LBP72_00250, partial [Dysgonamonadaceae bacterium]|jgi:hypothetical protein|nr:hypothetical protein [Dysgonamonadaceae bacterium]